ncbi:hypothetical protein [Pseudodonghicola flavimaris]|uniref:Uncharacterized protein n=1 Tax=Pseudodonghicola flavimaris TaxID=3050036 RepID=A0ABT7EYD1_9RHOB|nr:hypothetical protein [Pseudodonghicola flavimaris]MDK3017364.1 hypothetical protein [Pseudodonghicola flavimaris]
MASLKYAWLQETLSELIRHMMAEGLYPACTHLNAALDKLRAIEGNLSPRATSLQVTTVRLALEECLTMLRELGEDPAADDIARALAHLPTASDDGTAAPPQPRTTPPRDD